MKATSKGIYVYFPCLLAVCVCVSSFLRKTSIILNFPKEPQDESRALHVEPFARLRLRK